MDNDVQQPRVLRVDHEDRDVNARALLWFGVALIAGAIIVHVALWGLFRVYRHQAAPKDLPVSMVQGGRATAPPEPRLQYDPVKDLEEMRAGEQKILDGYGWIDQRAGIVHIPIEQAIRLSIQRGAFVEQKAAGQVPVAAPAITVPGGSGSGTQTQPPPQTPAGVAHQESAHP